MSQGERAESDSLAAEERRRLLALHELGVLDTEPEDVFDGVATMAATLTGARMAAVSLIDSDRQWFKARHGFEVRQTPRSEALCAHTILGDGLLYIPDAGLDPRWRSHPAVSGPAQVRFYAGAPLIGSRGEKYGTVCVFDTVPRQLTSHQQESIQMLARQASAQFEAARARRWADARDVAMQALVEALPEAVLAMGSDSQLRLLNEAARDWFGSNYEGSDPSQWGQLGRVTDRFGNALPPEAYPIVRALNGESVRDELIHVQTPRGDRLHLVCTAQPVCPAGRAPSAAVLIARRVDDTEGATGPDAALLAAALDCVEQGVTVADAAGRIVYANRAARSITGRSAGDICGTLAGENVLADAEWELQIPRPDGSVRDVVERLVKVPPGSRSASGVIHLLRDVTASRALARALHSRESTDPQTGLSNRSFMENRLGAALDKASAGDPQFLLYIDLDRFAVVNERFGHQAGDSLLAEVAASMAVSLGDARAVGRLQADEFVAVVQAASADEALVTAERLIQSIEAARIAWLDSTLSVSASIAVVSLTPNLPVNEVLSAARATCTLAKQKGRGRVLLHQPDDAELVTHRRRLRQRDTLDDALTRQQVVLYGQRIVPLASDAGRAHVEVLARIRDADGSLVAPGGFIPAAEHYGMMPALDRHILGATFKALARYEPHSLPLVCVNLSGASLADDRFAEYVAALLDRNDVSPGQICFEITETSAISNFESAERFINRFRGRGTCFALDDFGSGVSSFGYLKRLRVDFLKIDGAFIRNICTDPFDQAMVRAVRDVARTGGLKTVAEYVETEDVARYLASMGVDFGQGFGLHEPEPLHAALGGRIRARLW